MSAFTKNGASGEPNMKEGRHRHLPNEVDRSLTHAIGLVDSISYVASRSKKLSKLGLKMALHVGAI